MKKLLILALMAAGSLTACKKDSEPAPKSKSEILVDKRWRISAATATATVQGKLVTQDVYDDVVDDCNKDDFTTYKANKTYTDDAGATACQQGDPQTQSGTWDVNSDQTKLFLTDANQGNITLDLTEVSNTKLVLSTTDASQGFPITINLTFTAI
jgi:hypothetical protein